MTGPGDRGYDDALSSVRNVAEDLAVALAIWEARDDTRADAHARRAASGAVDAIDATLRALHAIRALITKARHPNTPPEAGRLGSDDRNSRGGVRLKVLACSAIHGEAGR